MNGAKVVPHKVPPPVEKAARAVTRLALSQAHRMQAQQARLPGQPILVGDPDPVLLAAAINQQWPMFVPHAVLVVAEVLSSPEAAEALARMLPTATVGRATDNEVARAKTLLEGVRDKVLGMKAPAPTLATVPAATETRQ